MEFAGVLGFWGAILAIINYSKLPVENPASKDLKKNSRKLAEKKEISAID